MKQQSIGRATTMTGDRNLLRRRSETPGHPPKFAEKRAPVQDTRFDMYPGRAANDFKYLLRHTQAGLARGYHWATKRLDLEHKSPVLRYFDQPATKKFGIESAERRKRVVAQRSSGASRND